MRSLDLLKDEKGSVLALAIILVVILTFSGLAFLHADFLEKRMGMEERWNQEAFYLANAGIERAKETMKVDGVTNDWTNILRNLNSNYPQDNGTIDPTAYQLLCNNSVTKGCVIPPFQTMAGNPKHIITTSDNGNPIKAIVSPVDGSLDMPFSQVCPNITGYDCLYSVRVFNNENNTTDLDHTVTLRALGNVRGKKKIIEVNVTGVSDLDGINCQGSPTAPCPNVVNGNPGRVFLPGHEPASHPILPSMSPALTSPSNYYRTPSNFPGLTFRAGPSGNSPFIPISNSYYLFSSSGPTNIGGSASNVVIVKTGTGTLNVSGGPTFNGVIFVSQSNISLSGTWNITARVGGYPTMIAGGDITGGSGSEVINGGMYAVGTISANPIDVHGIVVGNRVTIQGSSNYTDDGNLTDYGIWWGFTYPPELFKLDPVAQTWKEVQ